MCWSCSPGSSPHKSKQHAGDPAGSAGQTSRVHWHANGSTINKKPEQKEAARWKNKRFGNVNILCLKCCKIDVCHQDSFLLCNSQKWLCCSVFQLLKSLHFTARRLQYMRKCRSHSSSMAVLFDRTVRERERTSLESSYIGCAYPTWESRSKGRGLVLNPTIRGEMAKEGGAIKSGCLRGCQGESCRLDAALCDRVKEFG